LIEKRIDSKEALDEVLVLKMIQMMKANGREKEGIV
jgi:hypothetical protein